jgi:hypothetical protein
MLFRPPAGARLRRILSEEKLRLLLWRTPSEIDEILQRRLGETAGPAPAAISMENSTVNAR